MNKNNYLSWIIATAAGAIVGAIAVEQYKKYKDKNAAAKATLLIPKEVIYTDQL